VWGALLRTSKSVDEASFKPVIVSVGHGISLDSAIALTVLLTKHRIPEPVRQADLRGREWLRQYGAAADPNVPRDTCTRGSDSTSASLRF
jgi:hypothetical protein